VASTALLTYAQETCQLVIKRTAQSRLATLAAQ